MRRIFATTLLTATACSLIRDVPGSISDSMATTTGEATTVTETTSGGTSSGSTGTTAEIPTTSAPGTTSATGSTGTTLEPTTGAPSGYCQGFQIGAAEKFMSLEIVGGDPLSDGTVWPLECGAQGLWMFGIYPSLGGWDPMDDYVTFTIEVDVEGYNTNPAGHFFSGEVPYYIGCEQLDGGVVGVAPVFPLDTLPDLSVLDGLPAQVRVSVPADGDSLMAEAMVTLSAPMDLVMMGCML